MRRPGFTLLQGRNARLLLIALPILLVLAAAALIVIPARRALTRARLSVASAHQLAFNLQPVDITATHTSFEPVASTPNYTSGAFFAGQLYLAGPSGLTIFDPNATPQTTLRTGIELPVAPITTLLAARIRGTRDDAAHEAKPRIFGKRRAGAIEQRVLAGTGWADDENQHSGSLGFDSQDLAATVAVPQPTEPRNVHDTA